MEPITTKAALADFIKETTKGTVMAAFAEFREEQEKNSKASLAKSFELLASQRNGGQDEKVEKGLVLSRIVRSIAAGKGDVDKARAFAEKSDFGPEVVKALATQGNTAGGYIVPPNYSSDLIDLLYNRVAVRKLGAVSIPMPNGNLSIPKLTAGVSASYIGENSGTNAQQPTFGMISLNWKKLAAVVAISNDLIRYSSPKADEVVKNDLTNAFAVVEDATFLRSAGAGNTPKGLDAWIADGTNYGSLDHSFAAASADGSDLTLVIADLFKGPQALEEQNIPFVKPGWVISPRTKFFLMTVRDSVGGFYFSEEMRRGTLLGYPYVSTNQVPSTLGGGNDSVVYFGDFNDAVIGESNELMLDVSQEASYLQSGSLVSAFALDQTVIRGIARHDFVVRRVESFAKLTGVQWGYTA
jgi:HK97 family phage major capsid protein